VLLDIGVGGTLQQWLKLPIWMSGLDKLKR